MSYLKTMDGKWNIKHLTLISCGISVIILIIIGIIIYFKEKKSKSSSGNNTSSNGNNASSNGSSSGNNTTGSNGNNTTSSNGSSTTSNGSTTTSNGSTTTSNGSTTTSNGSTTTSIINNPSKIQLSTTNCFSTNTPNTCLAPDNNGNMMLSDCYSAPLYTLNTYGYLVNNSDNTQCISTTMTAGDILNTNVIETTCNPTVASPTGTDILLLWTYDNKNNIFTNNYTNFIMSAITGRLNIIVVQNIQPGQVYSDPCEKFLFGNII